MQLSLRGMPPWISSIATAIVARDEGREEAEIITAARHAR